MNFLPDMYYFFWLLGRCQQLSDRVAVIFDLIAVKVMSPFVFFPWLGHFVGALAKQIFVIKNVLELGLVGVSVKIVRNFRKDGCVDLLICVESCLLILPNLASHL